MLVLFYLPHQVVIEMRLFRDEFQRYRDMIGNRFFFNRFNGGFKTLFAHQFRLLRDRSRHGTVFNGFNTVFRAVKTDDKYLFTGALRRFNSTECHFIIVRENSLDFGVGL